MVCVYDTLHINIIFQMFKFLTRRLFTCASSSVARPPSRTANPFARMNGSKGDAGMLTRRTLVQALQ